MLIIGSINFLHIAHFNYLVTKLQFLMKLKLQGFVTILQNRNGKKKNKNKKKKKIK